MTDLVQRYADQRQESPFHNLQLIKVREPQSQVNEVAVIYSVGKEREVPVLTGLQLRYIHW
jgi:hypothetical protein